MATLKDYSEIILRKFPTDARLGFYAKPNMPAGKLGRALNNYIRLNPSDVIAMHEYGSMFSGGTLAFTATQLNHPKGFIKYEDILSASAREQTVDVAVNQGGTYTSVNLKTENDEAARLLARLLDDIMAEPKADDLVPERDYAAEGFRHTDVSWLNLRDEVMRTIDQLHQRFQDGKLSLMEYENKKMDLLARL